MIKKSFDPILANDPLILILGSLPGDKSLEITQYYGFPQNRFWKIMFKFFNQDFTNDYDKRIQLIKENRIILWDVAYTAERNGSLDTAIFNEQPNDIENLLTKYPSISLIIFNGKKSEQMFKRYFKQKQNITYQVLPSTSPANAGYTFDHLFKIWNDALIKYLK